MLKTLVKLQIKLALFPAKIAYKVIRRVLGKGGADAGSGPSASFSPLKSTPTPPSASQPSPFDVQVDPGAILERMSAGETFTFVDVRQAAEVASGMIEGAMHIPTQDLPRRMTELDQAVETVLYCAAGVRSLDAAMFLREKGFENAWSLGGGLPHWQADGGEVVEP